jgi:hypothetical protein
MRPEQANCPHFRVRVRGGNCQDCGAWVLPERVQVNTPTSDSRAVIRVRIPLRLPTHGVSLRTARRTIVYRIAVPLANIFAVCALAWLGLR